MIVMEFRASVLRCSSRDIERKECESRDATHAWCAAKRKQLGEDFAGAHVIAGVDGHWFCVSYMSSSGKQTLAEGRRQ